MKTITSPCPACGSIHRQTKAGKTTCGSQRFQCQDCKHYYTPAPKQRGYSSDTREAAIRLYLEGAGFRRVGRLLGVHNQTVINWVEAYLASLEAKEPDTALPFTSTTLFAVEKRASSPRRLHAKALSKPGAATLPAPKP